MKCLIELLIAGCCLPIITTVLGYSEQFLCTFNGRHFCAMEQESYPSSTLNWTLNSYAPDLYFYAHVYLNNTTPALLGNKARLVTPLLQSGSFNIEFWHYARGDQVGNMAAYARAEGSEYYRMLWNLNSGLNSTNMNWTKIYFVMSEPQNFQIVFEAVVSGLSEGEIGLDSIAMIRNGVYVTSPPPSPYGLPQVCDFDLNDFCEFEHYNYSSQCYWKLSNDNIPSRGHHLSMEASSTEICWKSVLSTREFWPNSSCYQVNFLYHTYGSKANMLTVVQEGYDEPLWKTTLSERDEWIPVELQFNTSHPTRVLFIGERANSSTTAHGLDEIEINDCGERVFTTQKPKESNLTINQSGEMFLCTFNENHMCNMEQEGPPSDTLNWTLDYDTTNSKGHLLLDKFPPNSPPAIFGEKARLVTPLLQNGSFDIKFRYYARGDKVGKIAAYARAEGSKYYRILWHLNSDFDLLSESWTNISVSLLEPRGFQIVFEAVVGSGFGGDIGLDDITIERIGDYIGTSSSLSYGLPQACDFDENNFCEFEHNSYSSQCYWKLSNEQTSNADNRTSGRGYYLHMETSSTEICWKSVLSTKEFWPNSSCSQVNFLYHTYGSEANALTVVQQGYDEPLWQTTLSERDEWIPVELQFNTSHPTRVLFMGTRGDSAARAHGVDEIVISDCSYPTTTITATTPNNGNETKNGAATPENTTSVRINLGIPGINLNISEIEFTSSTTRLSTFLAGVFIDTTSGKIRKTNLLPTVRETSTVIMLIDNKDPSETLAMNLKSIAIELDRTDVNPYCITKASNLILPYLILTIALTYI